MAAQESDSESSSDSSSYFSISVITQKTVPSPVTLAQLNGYEVQGDVIHISNTGNVILRFLHARGTAMFLVDSKPLISRSRYFTNLLDASRGFAEAQRVSNASNDENPILDLEFPADQAIAEKLADWAINVIRLAHFLRLVHGGRMITGSPDSQKVDDLFFLGICWDRYVIDQAAPFGAFSTVTVRTKPKRRYFQSANFDWPSWDSQQEIECRKLIFACIRLGAKDHVAVLTQNLIVMGSRIHDQWLGITDEEGSESIIWDLPAHIEEEIFLRRRMILAAIAAVLDEFVTQYNSTALQCRFGYSDSRSCDLFQLGQMMRFLSRKQVSELRTSRWLLGRADSIGMYQGSLVGLIKSLRAVPDAQVDANHQHCGIRKDLIPLLDVFEATINREKSIGICGICWSSKAPIKWAEPGGQAKKAHVCPDHLSHVKGWAAFESGQSGALVEDQAG